MVGIAPFRALVPDRDVVARSVDGAALGAVRLARRDAHPHHVAWLEGGGERPPADARTWRRQGHLLRDGRPTLRWVEQVMPSGRAVGGPLGLVRLDDLVPHETVDPGAVARRAARDGTQQLDVRPLLAVLPADPAGLAALRSAAVATTPSCDVVDEAGVRHLVWSLPTDLADAVVDVLAGVPALLADGHHRVAASRAVGHSSLPTLLATAATAPTLLPVWRQVATSAPEHEVLDWIGDGDQPTGAITLTWKGRHVTRPTHEMPVVAAHRLALDVPGGGPVRSTTDEATARAAARDGSVVVGTSAPTVAEVIAHVTRHGPLPPKSTAFHPKPRVGLVLAPRDAPDRP